MDFETILHDVADGVATITLNRPEKLNSFTEQMHHELRSALSQAKSDATVRAVVLTGAGRGFCAGQDLSDRVMNTDDPDAQFDLGETLETLYNPLVTLITSMEKPVLCAVNGVAAGAGANVALACDIVIAGQSASFLEPFCRLGLVPDAGGTWSLTHRIGPARAKGLSLLGDKIPAQKAADWGLIWECVPDDTLMETVGTMARTLANGPTKGYAKTKQAINAAGTNTFTEQLAMEATLQRELGRSEDYREGVTAFLEKRTPVFKGR